jgi:biopolymer transport protein ExbB
MIVAIIALLFLRVFLSLQTQQIDYFTEVGNELELIYRQYWTGGPRYQPDPSLLGEGMPESRIPVSSGDIY